MQQSVPSPSEVQATLAATLFDEWIQRGLRDVVICPGSRSTPLALAAAERAELNLHVRLDERSAGFFAIGRALVSERPVAVVVTSGTAAAELHACVAEADQAFVPLLVLTADRPPELHGVGAPQTIDQHHLFASMVRRFEEPGVARLESRDQWRALATRLWCDACATSQPGPVHLNVAFVEPLVATALALPERVEVEAVAAPVRTETEVDLSGLRVLCVVGRGADSSVVERCGALGWVVVGDATTEGALAYFDPLLRSDAFADRARPEVVVRLGGLVASKVLGERLRQWGAKTIAFDGAGFVADPDRLISETLPGLPSGAQRAREDYVELWRDASDAVGRWLEDTIGDESPLCEPSVARTVVQMSAERAVPLVVGSSMPVRDVEWWAPSRHSKTFSNRGVNGIDGVVSTVLGVAAGAAALGLVGDLTMLHDVSALVDGLGETSGHCVLVVVDNRGGGIFSFLSQATLVAPERFERLFGTPRPHDLARVAQAFGHHAELARTPGELRAAIDRGLIREGLSVVVAVVADRDNNVRLHQEWNDTVGALVEVAS